MNTTKYYIRLADADFMEQLLEKLGYKTTRVNLDRAACFTLEGYTMRSHVLVEDIFERMIDTAKR
jgi:hypothetical protein